MKAAALAFFFVFLTFSKTTFADATLLRCTNSGSTSFMLDAIGDQSNHTLIGKLYDYPAGIQLEINMTVDHSPTPENKIVALKGGNERRMLGITVFDDPTADLAYPAWVVLVDTFTQNYQTIALNCRE